MRKPENQTRKLKVVELSPRDQQKQQRRESRERKAGSKQQWTDRTPPPGNDAA